MEYLVGLALCLAVGGLAVAIGFDRDRAFYPTVLIVIATYYVLFAAMGASARALIMEIVAASGFSALADRVQEKSLAGSRCHFGAWDI